MTNGEKFKEVFQATEGQHTQDDSIISVSVGEIRMCFLTKWWNAEYKIFESVGIAIDNMIDEIQHWESDDTQDDYQRGAMDMQKYVLRVIDKYRKDLTK